MKKTTKNLISLLLIFNCLGIYFISNDYDILGLIDYEDFLSIFNIIISLFLIVITKSYTSTKNGFKKWICFFIIMIFMSAFQSYFLFNQSIFSGLLIQKELLSAALLYFPISKIVNNEVLRKDELFKLLDKFATIQLFLFITQYLLSSKVSFLTVYTAERYGDIRYYFNPILLDLFLIRKLQLFLNGTKKDKFKSLLFIGVILFEVMVVQKFRLTSIGLIITILFGLLLNKTKVLNKIKYLILGSGFSLFILNTRLVQDLISEFTTTTKTYTYSIREVGRKLYLDMVSKHPLLGGGYPVSDIARSAAGYDQKIILGDNGIFGFMYIYGILGLIWLTTLWFKLLKEGYKILKKTNNIVYFLFPLFLTIICINEIHWYWQSGFIIFILFLICFENEMNKGGSLDEKNT